MYLITLLLNYIIYFLFSFYHDSVSTIFIVYVIKYICTLGINIFLFNVINYAISCFINF